MEVLRSIGQGAVGLIIAAVLMTYLEQNTGLPHAVSIVLGISIILGAARWRQ